MDQILPLVAYALVLGGGLVWIWPRPDRAILLLIAALPIHTLAMVLIFHLLHPKFLVLYEGWKDIVIFVVLVRVVLRHEALADQRLHALDVAVALLSAFALLTIPLHADLGLRTQLLGLRNDFVLAPFYLIGRLMVTDARARRHILSAMAIIGIAFTAVGVVEYFISPLHWLVSIEYPKYLKVNFGQQSLTADAIPYPYFTSGRTRRMGSIFLTPVGLAEGGGVVLAAGIGLLALGLRNKLLGVMAVAAGILAPILALDRTQLVITPILLILIAVIARLRWSIVLAATSTTAVAGFLLFAVVSPASSRFSFARLVGDPSASSHFTSLGDALNLIATDPFGHGLGTAGAVGGRTGHSGGEGQLLVIVNSLGDVGLLLTAIIMGLGMFICWRALSRGADPAMALAALVLLIAITLTIPVAEVFDNIFVVLCAFWMLGQVARLEVLSKALDVAAPKRFLQSSVTLNARSD